MDIEGGWIGLVCIAFGLLLAGNARCNPAWYTYPVSREWRVMLLGRDRVRKLDFALGVVFAIAGAIVACGVGS